MQYYIEITVLLLLYVAEHHYPAIQRQGRDGHAATNLSFYCLNLAIIYAAGWALSEWRDPAHGLLQQAALPWIVSYALAFLLIDTCMYALHRITHATPVLWRLHRLHHADTAVDVTTALRTHGGEMVIVVLAQLAIIAAFGISAPQMIAYALVSRLVVLLHHSNIALPERADRILRSVIVSPRMHRVHHSPNRMETDSNYGTLFSFWDRLFGTYRAPGSHTPFGLEEFSAPWWQTFLGGLAMPFVSAPRQPHFPSSGQVSSSI